MNRKTMLIVVVFVCLVTGIIAFGVHAGTDYSGQKWEYLWAKPTDYKDDFFRPQIASGFVANGNPVDYEGAIYDWMNGIGAQGWEFIDMVDGFFVFKRPKLDSGS